MDPIQAKFFHSGFDIEYQGQSLNLQGLFSEQGITKIFLSAGLSDFWKNAIGQPVNVSLPPLKLSGVLLQQHVEHGSFFEIRFRGLDENQKAFLRQRMTAEGISPGWQRKFPRINVNGIQDPDFPVPNLCMVRFASQDFFVNVLNFTLGGLRIETLGDHLGEVRVGAMLSFDLLTTTGSIMANLSAEVRNLTAHEHEDKTITRSFGLRFVNMDPANEKKYREMIRDYCLLLQKRLSGP
ncbi:MAG: PilZ domain-containing protein [Bacteriovoracia bacterium]